MARPCLGHALARKQLLAAKLNWATMVGCWAAQFRPASAPALPIDRRLGERVACALSSPFYCCFQKAPPRGNRGRRSIIELGRGERREREREEEQEEERSRVERESASGVCVCARFVQSELICNFRTLAERQRRPPPFDLQAHIHFVRARELAAERATQSQ